MLDHLRPSYTENFRCTGAECEHNCCGQWEVIFDKATYQKYQAVPALQVLLDKNFTLNPDSPSDDLYASVKFTESSLCPFLSQGQLCQIQQKYGYDYLPYACATYPRVPRRVDGVIEKALYLSCPEAARLVLLGQELVHDPGTAGSRRYARFLKMTREAVVTDTDPRRYFWDLREFSLLLLRDRTHPLWQRLFLLGMLCKRLKEVALVRQHGLIPKILHDYAELVAENKLRSAMEGIPVQVGPQIEMVMEVVFGYLGHKNTGLCDIHECLQVFLHGIGYDSSPVLESCMRLYMDAYNQYYLPLMEEHPFLLENYLVNHIFRTQFPFGTSPGDKLDMADHEYVFMCLEFAMIKGLLIGMAGHFREAFTTEHVVKLAHTFAKSVEHTPAMWKAINWTGLAESNSIAALLKN